jgi:hypothetical protein
MVFGSNGLAIHVSNVRWSILVRKVHDPHHRKPKTSNKKIECKKLGRHKIVCGVHSYINECTMSSKGIVQLKVRRTSTSHNNLSLATTFSSFGGSIAFFISKVLYFPHDPFC